MSGDPAEGSPVLEIREAGLAVIRFDDPARKVNTLGADELRRLDALISEVESRGDIRRLVLASGKPGVFIAGADIEAIAGVETADAARNLALEGQRIYSRLAALDAVTVAAIGGTCLGGGLELALACDIRVAADDPAVSFGLPEVRLGIVPGFGGTQRLPRLVGFRTAVEIAVAGGTLRARLALAKGLVDRVVSADELESAAATARPGRRRKAFLDWLLASNRWLRALVVSQVRKRTARMVPERFVPAPYRALDLIDASYRLPLELGLEREAEVLGECLVTEASRNLVGIFMARNDLRRRASSWRGAEPGPAGHVAVIGAGVMGSGIAGAALDAGCRVALRDIDADAARAGGLRVEAGLAKRVDRGRLAGSEAAARRERLDAAEGTAGLESCDLLVEAIVERLDAKRALFASMERIMRPDAVLATNTSALSVGAMAEGLAHPARVVGMHFFNPVHRMPLLEIIPGPATDARSVATAADLGRRLGKVPVVVRDAPGFLVNRILMPYLGEALWMVTEGVAFTAIDRAARRFGMPMGPIRLLDEIGLDVALHAAGTLRQAFGERVAGPDLLARMVEAGRLGAKSGRGFYDAKRQPAPGATALVEGYGLHRGAPDEIRDRLVLAMVGEAARVLDEGVVERPVDVDMGMILGTGFAPWRGGPLRYADSRGPGVIAARMRQLAERCGERLAPPARLDAMARSGERFYPPA